MHDGISCQQSIAKDIGQHRTDQQATDPIDRQSARPNFLIQIYPGPLGIPTKVEKITTP